MGDVAMTDERRRSLLADMMEHILTAQDDGWTSNYIDADSGVMDVRFSRRDEWTEAVRETLRRHALKVESANL